MTRLTDLKTPQGWLNEAKRYLENAREILRTKAKLDYKYNIYKDVKYVREACGIAYLAVEMALEAYLMHRGRPVKSSIKYLKKKKRASYERYIEELRKLNQKLMSKYLNAYQILHLDGYYDGINDKNVIQAGLKSVEEIIKMVERNISKK